MAVISRDLGPITAYAAAVNRGYEGTREEFEQLMASYASVAQQAGESASQAAGSADNAESSATAAAASASIASSSASAAATSAGNASNSASAAQSAQTAAESARDATQTAQSAAEAAQAGVEATASNFDTVVVAAIRDVNATGTNQKELAKRQAEKSEAWAVGQISGEDVGVSDPAYHNNAKYYAEQTTASSQQIIADAAAEKTAAQTARQGAETAETNASASASAAAASAAEAAASAQTLTIDSTLSQSGQAADAKVVGDAIESIAGKRIAMSAGYIKTDADPVDINNIVSHARFFHAVVSCEAGDIFTVSATGGMAPLSAVFVDSNGMRLLQIKDAIKDAILVAPENSTSLIINDYDGLNTSYYGLSYRIETDENNYIINGRTLTISSRSVGRKRIYVNVKKNVLYAATNNTGGPCSLFVVSEIGASQIAIIANGATVSFHSEYDGFAMEAYLNKVEGDIVIAEKGAIEQIEDLESRITSAESSITSLESRTTSAESSITSLESRTTSAESSITSLESRTTSAESDVTGIRHLFNGLAYSEVLKIAQTAGMTVDNDVISRKGSRGTFVISFDAPKHLPIIVRSKPTYTSNPPYIIISGNNTYKNKRMEMYNNSVGNLSELRIPPLDCGLNDYYNITIAFPEGSSVSYIEFAEEKSLQRRSSYGGIDVNAHLGFDAIAPENTMPAFLAAYRSGYDAIICNPKLTSDGVWVCVHDATINRHARNMDGTQISESISVADSTYEQLLAYDFGVAFNEVFAGTRIPTLDEFLKMCAVTGVRPIFSMHESSPSASFLESLCNIVSKYGLTKELILKINIDNYRAYHDVFGEIYMYDFVVSTEIGVNTAISTIKEQEEYSKERMMIDVPINIISAAIAKSITDENIICGVYDLQGTLFSRYRTMINYGVTQFTDDNYPVTGLKWN